MNDTDREELEAVREQVLRLLEPLKTEADVYRACVEADAKGWPDDGCRCPLASLISSHIGADVAVSSQRIDYLGGLIMWTPEPCNAFLSSFDNGKYRDLRHPKYLEYLADQRYEEAASHNPWGRFR